MCCCCCLMLACHMSLYYILNVLVSLPRTNKPDDAQEYDRSFRFVDQEKEKPMSKKKTSYKFRTDVLNLDGNDSTALFACIIRYFSVCFFSSFSSTPTHTCHFSLVPQLLNVVDHSQIESGCAECARQPANTHQRFLLLSNPH